MTVAMAQALRSLDRAAQSKRRAPSDRPQTAARATRLREALALYEHLDRLVGPLNTAGPQLSMTTVRRIMDFLENTETE